MSIAKKLITVAENINKVYEAGKAAGGGSGEDNYDQGYKDGYAKAESVNPMFYMDVKGFQWNSKAFPEGFDFVLKLRDKPSDMNAMLMRTTGLKSVTLICDAEGTTSFAQLVRETPIITLDLSNFKPKPNNISYMCLLAGNLVSIIGALDLSQCTNVTGTFLDAKALENIEFVPNTIPISIKFDGCKKLTHDSLLSIINGLMDYGEKTYDITDNPFVIIHAMEMPMQYIIDGVSENEEGYEISAIAAADGKTYLFFCPKSYNYSQEIINALKEGTYFNIDCEIVGGSWKVNSWTTVLGSDTTQTLTLGTTNLAKLTDEEKAIATEKGWTLA